MSKGNTGYRKLKRVLIVLVILLAAFAIYVEIVNRNSKQMTYRQKVLKAVYPVWMWFARTTGKHKEQLSETKKAPVSFYTLKARLNNGDSLDFNTLKGKKVVIVNTASECGYTDQYSDLQKLYKSAGDKLVIIGFPANDFKNQESGANEQIAQFCKANYGVTFPIAEKSVVVRSAEQNPVFTWLTDPALNGWNDKQPGWNFSKYVIDESGNLTHYFGSSVSPGGKEFMKAIE